MSHRTPRARSPLYARQRWAKGGCTQVPPTSPSSCNCGSASDHGYGIYKPVRGEQPLWDFPRGLYRRECAAYEVAQLLGWPVVPPTAIRNDGELGVGSLQLFVIPQQDSNYFAVREYAQEAVFQMAVFDIIVNNADRKGRPLLRGTDRRRLGRRPRANVPRGIQAAHGHLGFRRRARAL